MSANEERLREIAQRVREIGRRSEWIVDAIERTCQAIQEIESGDVWLVVMGNYEPPEVVSVHRTEEGARGECARMNDARAPGSVGFDVQKWRVSV